MRRRLAAVAAAGLCAVALSACGGLSLSSIEQRVSGGSSGETGVACVAKVLRSDANPSLLSKWVSGKISDSQFRHDDPSAIASSVSACAGG